MQNFVKEFNDKKMCHKKTMSVSARVLDVVSEIGELAKEVLENSKNGTENFYMSDDFKLEFGDVLYSILSLANELNIEAKDCLKSAIKKYEDRIIKKNSMGSKK